MSFLGKLFGSTKVISKGVDGIYNGVDKLVYTDEEKADNFRLMMKIYEPFKLAQRFMMMIVCPPYVLAWFITFIVSFFANVEAQKAMLEGRMGDLVLAIASFYFLGGAAEGTMRGVNWLKGKIKD
jgi:hypothetical protein